MSAVETPSRAGVRVAQRPDARWAATLRRDPSTATVCLCLLGLFAATAALHAFFATFVHGPTVFSDEIGYTKLAESIGRTGRFALFNEPGLSYSPLYPLVLSPIYALGASAPTAYGLIKLVNAILISLAIFPTYKIARFVLSRRLSLVVAGLSALAPLLAYSSFTVSENLAYPLCLLAVWAILEAVRTPCFRTDAFVIGSILLATAARIQLIVLAPVALSAFVLAPILERDEGVPIARRLLRAASAHALVVGLMAFGLVVVVGGALAGHEVFSVLGRYDVVSRAGLPNLWDFLDLLIRHLAGIDLAVAVAPFAGTLAAAAVFFVSGRPRRAVPFAAVGIATGAWLLIEVAFDAALFDLPAGGDIPRIHERFLIYVVPLFLTGLVAASRIPESPAVAKIFLGAGVFAALLPLAIPFHTVVNNTVNYESFGLHPFSRVVEGQLASARHATLIALWYAGTVALLYTRVRRRLVAVVALVAFIFIGISLAAQGRIVQGGNAARMFLPAHTDWVDRLDLPGDVVLFTGAGRPKELQTAYANFSIKRLYYVCRAAFGAEFGEQEVTIDRAGRLSDASGFVRARYVVTPWSFGIRGRVIAWNANGGDVLVAPPPGPLVVSPPQTPKEFCPPPATGAADRGGA
jgi:hypothetical protein